jgi:Ran GTPase-activating protein (RanGAP) involved in mRNA processing and transport
LTSLNLQHNGVREEGAMVIADALQENTTLTSLDLSQNYIPQEGASYFATALTYNPTLIHLKVHFKQSHSLYDNFMTTFHNLQGILNILIGEDGAQVLGMAFQIKSRSKVLF